jgi:hypothetical protein
VRPSGSYWVPRRTLFRIYPQVEVNFYPGLTHLEAEHLRDGGEGRIGFLRGELTQQAEPLTTVRVGPVRKGSSPLPSPRRPS